MALYFIADLPLSSQTPEITAGFSNFSKSLIPGDKLYILGDLFDYYVGINIHDEAQNELKKIVLFLKEQQVSVYFIHGNRDFLLSKKDAQYFGFELLKDIHVLTAYEKKIVLAHGDEICPEKFNYQFFRSFSLIKCLQVIFNTVTTKEQKVKIALQMREQSKLKFEKRNFKKVKISLPKALALLYKHKAQILIHGHTHSFSETKINGIAIYDTGNWQTETFSYISLSDTNGIELHSEKI